MNTLLTSLNVLQSGLGIYGVYLSYISITNLSKYEKTSEKAAEWSTTASEQLQKTKTTQTSGLVAVLSSTISSLYCLYKLQYFESKEKHLSLVMALVTFAAWKYVGDFWKGSAKLSLPLLEGYNAAIARTETLGTVLGSLGLVWMGSAVGGFI